MPGTNPASLENTMNRAPLQKGVLVPIPLPGYGDVYVSASGSPAANGGAPADSESVIPVTSGAGWVMAWQGAATTTNTLAYDYVLDEAFCENYRDMHIKHFVRKIGSGTDNTDLAIRCLIQAMVPGDTTLRTLVAAASNIMTPTAKVTTLTWQEWEMDLRALLSATNLAYLQRGTMLRFTYSPNEAIGTDLQLEVGLKAMHARKHLHVVEDLTELEPRF